MDTIPSLSDADLEKIVNLVKKSLKEEEKIKIKKPVQEIKEWFSHHPGSGMSLFEMDTANWFEEKIDNLSTLTVDPETFIDIIFYIMDRCITFSEEINEDDRQFNYCGYRSIKHIMSLEIFTEKKYSIVLEYAKKKVEKLSAPILARIEKRKLNLLKLEDPEKIKKLEKQIAKEYSKIEKIIPVVDRIWSKVKK